VLEARRLRVAFSVAASVVGAVLVAVLVLAPLREPIARRYPTEDRATGAGTATGDVSVRCGFIGTSSDDDWGGAAGAVCEEPALRRFRLVGVVGLVAGTAGLALVAWSRRRDTSADRPSELLGRLVHAVSSLLVGLGLVAGAAGLMFGLFADKVTELTIDYAAVTDVVSGSRVVAGFEVVGLGTAGGGRYEQEIWLIIPGAEQGGADIAEIRSAVLDHGWTATDVLPEHSDGWVAYRGLAGPGSTDQVEIGRLADALHPNSDLSRSARTMLEREVPDDLDAVAIHLQPSRLAA
jgi:hypothetical protein